MERDEKSEARRTRGRRGSEKEREKGGKDNMSVRGEREGGGGK